MSLTKCPRCNGEGYIPNFGTASQVACDLCSGRGWISEGNIDIVLMEIRKLVDRLDEQEGINKKLSDRLTVLEQHLKALQDEMLGARILLLEKHIEAHERDTKKVLAHETGDVSRKEKYMRSIKPLCPHCDEPMVCGNRIYPMKALPDEALADGERKEQWRKDEELVFKATIEIWQAIHVDHCGTDRIKQILRDMLVERESDL